MKSQWFFNWLECEPRGLALFRHLLSALLAILAWFYAVDVEVLCATRLFLIKDESMTLRLVLPLVVFGSAIWEELRYRLLPFVLARRWQSKTVLIIALFTSSAIFGWSHGNFSLERLPEVLHKGVPGLILGLVFLKCGGMNDKLVKPLICCSLVHFASNFITVSYFYYL